MVAHRRVDCVYGPRSTVPPDGYFLGRFNGYANSPFNYGRRLQRRPLLVSRRAVYRIHYHPQRPPPTVYDGYGRQCPSLVGRFEGRFLHTALEFLVRIFTDEKGTELSVPFLFIVLLNPPCYPVYKTRLGAGTIMGSFSGGRKSCFLIEEKRATFLKQCGYPCRKITEKKGFLAQGLTRFFFFLTMYLNGRQEEL